tara:strand:+ start:271 stop:468 length:198 start_codon:yes stop_codon:yes gene_type:complete
LSFPSDDVNQLPIVVEQLFAEPVFHHFGLAIGRIDKLKKKSRMLGVFVIIICENLELSLEEHFCD